MIDNDKLLEGVMKDLFDDVCPRITIIRGGDPRDCVIDFSMNGVDMVAHYTDQIAVGTSISFVMYDSVDPSTVFHNAAAARLLANAVQDKIAEMICQRCPTRVVVHQSGMFAITGGYVLESYAKEDDIKLSPIFKVVSSVPNVFAELPLSFHQHVIAGPPDVTTFATVVLQPPTVVAARQVPTDPTHHAYNLNFVTRCTIAIHPDVVSYAKEIVTL